MRAKHLRKLGPSQWRPCQLSERRKHTLLGRFPPSCCNRLLEPALHCPDGRQRICLMALCALLLLKSSQTSLSVSAIFFLIVSAPSTFSSQVLCTFSSSKALRAPLHKQVETKFYLRMLQVTAGRDKGR